MGVRKLLEKIRQSKVHERDAGWRGKLRGLPINHGVERIQARFHDIREKQPHRQVTREELKTLPQRILDKISDFINELGHPAGSLWINSHGTHRQDELASSADEETPRNDGFRYEVEDGAITEHGLMELDWIVRDPEIHHCALLAGVTEARGVVRVVARDAQIIADMFWVASGNLQENTQGVLEWEPPTLSSGCRSDDDKSFNGIVLRQYLDVYGEAGEKLPSWDMIRLTERAAEHCSWRDRVTCRLPSMTRDFLSSVPQNSAQVEFSLSITEAKSLLWEIASVSVDSITAHFGKDSGYFGSAIAKGRIYILSQAPSGEIIEMECAWEAAGYLENPDSDFYEWRISEYRVISVNSMINIIITHDNGEPVDDELIDSHTTLEDILYKNHLIGNENTWKSRVYNAIPHSREDVSASLS